jgi:integrase
VDGTSFDERFTGTKSDARKRLNQLRAEAANGTLARSDGTTVAELIADYISHRVKLGKVRPGKPEDTYRSYLRNRIGPVIGRMQVADVRPAHAQRVVDAMIEDGCAPSSIRQVDAICHGAFRWALQQRRIAVNPFDAVSLPAARRRTLVTPDPKTLARILARVEPDYLVPIKMAAATGLRRGEVCAARWNGLFADGTHEGCSMSGVPHLHVEGTMQRVDGRLRVMPPKTERGRRAVPIPAFLVEILREHRREQNERRIALGPGWADHDLIVEAGNGSPLDPDNLGDAFRRARARAGVTEVRLHDLRRTASLNWPHVKREVMI